MNQALPWIVHFILLNAPKNHLFMDFFMFFALAWFLVISVEHCFFAAAAAARLFQFHFLFCSLSLSVYLSRKKREFSHSLTFACALHSCTVECVINIIHSSLTEKKAQIVKYLQVKHCVFLVAFQKWLLLAFVSEILGACLFCFRIVGVAECRSQGENIMQLCHFCLHIAHWICERFTSCSISRRTL